MSVPPAASAVPCPALPIEARLVVGALVLRIVSSLVAFLANVTLPVHTDQGFTFLGEPHAFWDAFTRYDSGWYYGVASRGYAYVEGGRSNLAFFPLYPTLMGWAGRLIGGSQADFYFAGLVISWVSFAFAMALAYRLARLDMRHDHALRAVLYSALMPGAYFFGMVYSESLFLLTLVGAVLALRERRWWWAAVAGAAMTATRVNGVMFVPVLAWIAWRAVRDDRERPAAVAAVAASVLGIGGYALYSYALSGDALAWYHSIQRWGYYPGGNPLSGLASIGMALLVQPYSFLTTRPMAPYDTLNALSAVVALCAVPLIWRRFGGPYAAMILVGLLLPLSSGQMEGLGRYCAVLFPVPFLLGTVEGDTRHVVFVATAAMLYTLGLVLFVNLHPLY